MNNPRRDRLLPDDAYNRELAANVRPSNWSNPQSSGAYNLAVIGAGTAGLVTAVVAAGLGAKVALIEKALMGGDCLNAGCVPSKALIRAARAWYGLRNAEEFGLRIAGEVGYDFSAAMARMRRLRARISNNDSVERYTGLGVDVYLGEGRFTGGDRIAVGDQTLIFKKAVICTGTRASAPPISGLMEAGYLTNETVFDVTALPRRLAVIGAGPIGCELAQTFARFGSEVWVLERAERILVRDDPDAARVVQQRMESEGVKFALNAGISQVSRAERGKIVAYETQGRRQEVCVDEVLVGVGRAPNVAGLGLEAAGVDFDPTAGVRVDDHLRTTNPLIYAAGDVCSAHKFTHVADALAQIVIQNALFPHPFGLGYATTRSLLVPWCTYTTPEIAHVGMTAAACVEQGTETETYTYDLAEVDRAILDSEEEGFARLHIKKGADRILGATVVAEHAGEIISEITVLMRAGRGVKTLLASIHPYPTQAEAMKKAANLWRKTRLTATMKRLLTKYYEWSRSRVRNA